MSIPEYIINAAKEYSNGNENLFNAFIAGYKATRQPKSKNITLSCEQEKAFDSCWKEYGRKGNKALAKRIWADIPISSLAIISKHITAYVGSREKRFTKDFERYLKDGEYNKIVFNGNNIIFDPTQADNIDEYIPKTDGIFQYWDDANKVLRFNGDIANLDDGYTSDNRPDGATVSWGMYSWKWSKQNKEWRKQ